MCVSCLSFSFSFFLLFLVLFVVAVPGSRVAGAWNGLPLCGVEGVVLYGGGWWCRGVRKCSKEGGERRECRLFVGLYEENL